MQQKRTLLALHFKKVLIMILLNLVLKESFMP